MTTHIVAILLAIVGVAIVALLVSNHAQTGSLLGSAGKSFGGALGCALSPVTGQGCGTSVSSKISFG
jgi:hypothetical protein